MTQTTTATTTRTFTDAEVEAVGRRFTADILMIAQSSGAITEDKARDYAHDVEVLAKKGFLTRVDFTLLSGGVEQCATQYTVNTESGDLTMSRPGGVMWPRLANAQLRVILSYTATYTADEKTAMRPKLRVGWVPSDADTSHTGLKTSAGRDYASNAFGIQRKDYTQ